MPRSWEAAGKKTEGRGQGWRLGQMVLGVAQLAFLGSIILAQYAAGVPMTAKLLVPLIMGALVGKGWADKARAPFSKPLSSNPYCPDHSHPYSCPRTMFLCAQHTLSPSLLAKRALQKTKLFGAFWFFPVNCLL